MSEKDRTIASLKSHAEAIRDERDRLRKCLLSWADHFEGMAGHNGGMGVVLDGSDLLEYANDMRIDAYGVE